MAKIEKPQLEKSQIATISMLLLKMYPQIPLLQNIPEFNLAVWDLFF